MENCEEQRSSLTSFAQEQGAVARHIMQKFYILSYFRTTALNPHFFYMDVADSLWTKLIVVG